MDPVETQVQLEELRKMYPDVLNIHDLVMREGQGAHSCQSVEVKVTSVPELSQPEVSQSQHT